MQHLKLYNSKKWRTLNCEDNAIMFDEVSRLQRPVDVRISAWYFLGRHLQGTI